MLLLYFISFLFFISKLLLKGNNDIMETCKHKGKIMKPFVEIEYKLMINEDLYHRLLEDYPLKTTKQVNHYFDTIPSLKEKGLAMRIRVIHDDYIFTLKEKLDVGHNEYEFKLHEFNFNDVRIQELFQHFQINDPKYLGFLVTYRSELEMKEGILCVDFNQYNGMEDYELEYELKDSHNESMEEFLEILDKYQLNFHENAPSKIKRFMHSLKLK